MFSEDDLLPLSALQHLLFCQRQCALIHIEGLWDENRLTALGKRLHERAHREGERELRGDVCIARGVRLRSLRLGLAGKADVVEFHRLDAAGVPLAGVPGLWRPFPVEYKRGRPKRNRCDEVQLCAQALCLEEMLGTDVPAGALFYGTTRRRFDVALGAALRAETEDAARRLHAMIGSGVTPRIAREPKCDHCSLAALCLPEATGPARSAARYTRDALRRSQAGDP
jgi:CRISPR-associated exonuclease Cas4